MAPKRSPVPKTAELARKARTLLSDRKGQDILILDMRGLSSVTDYFVIATAQNRPHLKTLADELERGLARDGYLCYRRAGTPESGWIVADYVDAVVHLFLPELRAYYGLESLWGDAPRVD